MEERRIARVPGRCVGAPRDDISDPRVNVSSVVDAERFGRVHRCSPQSSGVSLADIARHDNQRKMEYESILVTARHEHLAVRVEMTWNSSAKQPEDTVKFLHRGGVGTKWARYDK